MANAINGRQGIIARAFASRFAVHLVCSVHICENCEANFNYQSLVYYLEFAPARLNAKRDSCLKGAPPIAHVKTHLKMANRLNPQ